jgi:hypothetical protein
MPEQAIKDKTPVIGIGWTGAVPHRAFNPAFADAVPCVVVHVLPKFRRQ